MEEGDVLLARAAFGAVRPIERGPIGLIEALGRPDGTVVMPSWTDDDDRPFDATQTRAAADLGVVADAFWKLPRVRRSAHPFAFAASGPKAAQILSDPLALPPHQHASPAGKWNGRLPPLMLADVRVEVDPRGPTASKCQVVKSELFTGKPEGPR